MKIDEVILFEHEPVDNPYTNGYARYIAANFVKYVHKRWTENPNDRDHWRNYYKFTTARLDGDLGYWLHSATKQLDPLIRERVIQTCQAKFNTDGTPK